MRETLEKVIKNNSSGLFLLNPPTGFGKTTVVVDLICDFLRGNSLFFGYKKDIFYYKFKNKFADQGSF